MIVYNYLLIIGGHTSEIENLKEKMKVEFEMTDLGKISYFFGMEFVKARKCMIMHQ